MPTLLDMERPTFPFHDHFTQREVLAFDGLRLKLTDDQILDRFILERFMGKPVEEVARYIIRNPRREEAA